MPSAVMLPVGRRAWSLQYASNMAVGLGSTQATDEEARAEVDVLKSRLDKTSQLTKKIQASLGRLESTGKAVQDAVGPIYGNTQKLQIIGTNIDGILGALDRIRQPSDIKNNEEDIIRKGPDNTGLDAFLSSVNRVSKALLEMRRTNLRSSQQAVADLSRLLKSGNSQLEAHFQRTLQSDSRPIEPLQLIMKQKPFPLIDQEKMRQLRMINNYISGATKKSGMVGESPVLQTYANVRGPYLTATLQNLAAASINTAKKKAPDAVYRRETNGIGKYAEGMEGAFLAEYENIRALFQEDEWPKVLNLNCQGAISELTRTLRELNIHIKANLATDCYLAYEIIEIISSMSSKLDSRTGEFKPSFAAALKPIRETGKSSLADLLEDTRRRVVALPVIPPDGASIPITTETITRLMTMVNFLGPISSIMISLGDGGWKSTSQAVVSSDQIPTLNSFQIGADGKQIFGHYCIDTIDTLLSSLEQKAKPLLKGKPTLGVFIANNATVIERMVRSSELQPLLASRMADIDKWRKTGAQLYTLAWREPSTHLLDVQYTNRGSQRPPSGSTISVDSAAIIKGLSSKDKDAIKEKFRLFNTSFDELVAKHKSLSMEREVKDILSRQVQQMIEPLYCRFWDRYHEIDKGKGKYVKYDKAGISGVFLSLG